MDERKDMLKGGLGGKSTRMHERFKVEKPDQQILDKYFHHYSDRDLHFSTGDIIIPVSEHLFGNTHPTHFDFGCGRGEYVISMAQQYPERNFVGIDGHVRSLYIGIHKASDQKLPNVRFLRADVPRLIPYIPNETVEQASLLFPAPIVDPKNKKNDILVAPFVEGVHRVLIDDKTFLFLSDAEWYFNDKLALIEKLRLFKFTLIRKSIEDTSLTRYQEQWQNKGILTNRAEMQKLTSE